MKNFKIVSKIQDSITKEQILFLSKGFILGFLVIIGTFPDNDWSFSSGLDSSIPWVFNYLYDRGFDIGRHIVFPHGPLAFLMYPLQENIMIVSIIESLLKIFLVFNTLWLTGNSKKSNWFYSFLFAYVISIVGGLNQLMLANIILCYLNYYNTGKKPFKLAAFVLTAFAFYIKFYVAVLSGIIAFSFLLYYLFTDRKIIKTLIDTLIISGLILLIWVCMYGSFSGFPGYVTGLFHLAQDNSSAASYYPDNNWWYLSVSLLIMFSLPYLNPAKNSVFFGLLTTLSLFAAWKHGMAREDINHVNGFMIYVLIVLSLFILFARKYLFRNIVLSILVIFLIKANMKHAVNYFPSKYELFKVNNFLEFISDCPRLRMKSSKDSENNISCNRLPPGILNSIRFETVDIYPWDYSIIPANNLNWQPRSVIQSYASYTSWLDKRNADHFKSGKAPGYFIWKLDESQKDFNGNMYCSIDGRYLLNDEPRTLSEILKNYQFFYKDNKYLVLKKRRSQVQSAGSETGRSACQWGQWVPVPNPSGSLLRASMYFNESFIQKMKSFFYKDEQFWLHLKLINGVIHKYRIVPKNAEDGLWIYPYIYNAHYSKDNTVTQIMFQCSNQSIMSDSIYIRWNQELFNNEQDYVLNFFGIKPEQDDGR